MKTRHIKTLLLAASLMLAGHTTAQDESGFIDAPATAVKGYFRVHNAGRTHKDLNGEAKKWVVYVTSPSTANPTATVEEAIILPGTVLYIDAEPYSGDNRILLVKHLRSQGVDASATVYKRITVSLRGAFTSALKKWNDDYGWGFSTSQIDEIIAEMYEHTQMFMVPCKDSKGEDSYYLKSTVPVIYPLQNALTEEQLADLELGEGDLTQNLWNTMYNAALGIFEADGQLQIKAEFEFYRDRIHMGHTYYLITGRVDPYWYTHQQFVYNINNPSIGFANNNPYTDDYYGGNFIPEIDYAGDFSKWHVLPVEQDNHDNYFAVSPSEYMKGLNDGKYYCSLFVDYPFEIISPDVRVWSIQAAPVVSETQFEGMVAKVFPVELTGTIPTQTPVVIECPDTWDFEKDITNCLQPVGTPFGQHGATVLSGMFFGTTFDELDNPDNESFIYHAGQSDEQEIYRPYFRSFTRSTKVATNPIGFFKYSGTQVLGNRAFMIVDESLANANVVFGDYADGIEDVENHVKMDLSKTKVYDLQGRVVTQPTKGIYIVNGQKMVLK